MMDNIVGISYESYFRPYAIKEALEDILVGKEFDLEWNLRDSRVVVLLKEAFPSDIMILLKRHFKNLVEFTAKTDMEDWIKG
jgi:hypothetical protein